MKNKGFYKGIDLGGWMSQCDYSTERLDNFVKEEDFARIASWGLDHVRIPVDYNIFETTEGEYIEDGFRRLDDAFALCRKYGLKAVLDLHKTAGFSFDSYGESEAGFFENDALQERFIRLWEQFAQRYGNRPDTIAFELLNEVTDASFIGVWNAVIARCIPRIRAFAPETLILVGSYWNNSADAVKDLDAPYDENVIYNFHCYDPLSFTHQGAYWTDQIDQNARFTFEEAELTPEYFEKRFESAIATAKKYNTSLYCGEYGVIDKVAPEDVVKWFRCINSVFEKHGIARSAWNYKEMDFGISDERMDGVREELLKYL